MRRLVWLAAGVVLGFALAHEAYNTVRGRVLFDSVNDRMRDFRAAVADGYRSRDMELRFGPDTDRRAAEM